MFPTLICTCMCMSQSIYSLILNLVWKISKQSLSTQSPGCPGHPLQTHVVLISLPACIFLPFATQTLHFLVLDFISFQSGASLFPGQWFLPVNLMILSTAGSSDRTFQLWRILQKLGT